MISLDLHENRTSFALKSYNKRARDNIRVKLQAPFSHDYAKAK